MQKIEIKNAFINTLERERTVRGWTQWEMAEKLEMSVPGYRKMVSGFTESISLYTAYKASDVLNIPIPVLYGSKAYKDQLLNKIYNTPVSTCNKIEYYLDYDAEYRSKQTKPAEDKIAIDVVTLTGHMEDGMYLDSSVVEKVEIVDDYKGRVTRGFLVTQDSLLPAYAKGDILLVEERAARNGDTVIIANLKTKILYIRRLELNENYELHPIVNRGETIIIDRKDRSNWFDYGHVVTSIRSNTFL